MRCRHDGFSRPLVVRGHERAQASLIFVACLQRHPSVSPAPLVEIAFCGPSPACQMALVPFSIVGVLVHAHRVSCAPSTPHRADLDVGSVARRDPSHRSLHPLVTTRSAPARLSSHSPLPPPPLQALASVLPGLTGATPASVLAVRDGNAGRIGLARIDDLFDVVETGAEVETKPRAAALGNQESRRLPLREAAPAAGGRPLAWAFRRTALVSTLSPPASPPLISPLSESVASSPAEAPVEDLLAAPGSAPSSSETASSTPPVVAFVPEAATWPNDDVEVTILAARGAVGVVAWRLEATTSAAAAAIWPGDKEGLVSFDGSSDAGDAELEEESLQIASVTDDCDGDGTDADAGAALFASSLAPSPEFNDAIFSPHSSSVGVSSASSSASAVDLTASLRKRLGYDPSYYTQARSARARVRWAHVPSTAEYEYGISLTPLFVGGTGHALDQRGEVAARLFGVPRGTCPPGAVRRANASSTAADASPPSSGTPAAAAAAPEGLSVRTVGGDIAPLEATAGVSYVEDGSSVGGGDTEQLAVSDLVPSPGWDADDASGWETAATSPSTASTSSNSTTVSLGGSLSGSRATACLAVKGASRYVASAAGLGSSGDALARISDPEAICGSAPDGLELAAWTLPLCVGTNGFAFTPTRSAAAEPVAASSPSSPESRPSPSLVGCASQDGCVSSLAISTNGKIVVVRQAEAPEAEAAEAPQGELVVEADLGSYASAYGSLRAASELASPRADGPISAAAAAATAVPFSEPLMSAFGSSDDDADDDGEDDGALFTSLSSGAAARSSVSAGGAPSPLASAFAPVGAPVPAAELEDEAQQEEDDDVSFGWELLAEHAFYEAAEPPESAPVLSASGAPVGAPVGAPAGAPAEDSQSSTLRYDLQISRLASPGHAMLRHLDVVTSAGVFVACDGLADGSDASTAGASHSPSPSASDPTPRCSPGELGTLRLPNSAVLARISPYARAASVAGVHVEVAGITLNSASGSSFYALHLEAGVLVSLPIIVIAEDGMTSNEYTLRLRREAAETVGAGTIGAPSPTAGSSTVSEAAWEVTSGDLVAAPSNDAYCSACPRGWISSSINASLCALCPPGSVAPAAGSSACDACPAGTFAAFWGSTRCRPCLAGTHSSSAGSALCTLCPDGTASAGDGATTCGTTSPSPSPGLSPQSASDSDVLSAALVVSFGVSIQGVDPTLAAAAAGVAGSLDEVAAAFLRADTASAFGIPTSYVTVSAVSEVDDSSSVSSSPSTATASPDGSPFADGTTTSLGDSSPSDSTDEALQTSSMASSPSAGSASPSVSSSLRNLLVSDDGSDDDDATSASSRTLTANVSATLSIALPSDASEEEIEAALAVQRLSADAQLAWLVSDPDSFFGRTTAALGGSARAQNATAVEIRSFALGQDNSRWGLLTPGVFGIVAGCALLAAAAARGPPGRWIADRAIKAAAARASAPNAAGAPRRRGLGMRWMRSRRNAMGAAIRIAGGSDVLSEASSAVGRSRPASSFTPTSQGPASRACPDINLDNPGLESGISPSGDASTAWLGGQAFLRPEPSSSNEWGTRGFGERGLAAVERSVPSPPGTIPPSLASPIHAAWNDVPSVDEPGALDSDAVRGSKGRARSPARRWWVPSARPLARALGIGKRGEYSAWGVSSPNSGTS